MSRAAMALELIETPVQTVDRNFRKAAQLLNLDADLQTLLTTPKREVRMRIPLRMDDGSLAVFDAWQVQHNSTRGPALNTFRVHTAVDSNLQSALAQNTTWSCALANIPLGGAASGIACDTRAISERELQMLTRAFTSRACRLLGVHEEIIAPDIDTPPEIMGWVSEEYSALPVPGTANVAGNAVVVGDAIRHEVATGRSVCILAGEIARYMGLRLKDSRVIVQGFGPAAKSAARELVAQGCILVGIGDDERALYAAEGVDIEAVLAYPAAINDELAEAIKAESITADDLLTRECEILISAAGESALNGANAENVSARAIIEVSPLATTPIADSVFEERGIMVVPDILANAGAMIATFLEWEQNLEQKRCNEEHVRARLESMMLQACDAVMERAEKQELCLRSAAHCIAVERVARVEKLRGI